MYLLLTVIIQAICVLNKEILQLNLWFIIKRGFKSRAGYEGACPVVKILWIINMWLHNVFDTIVQEQYFKRIRDTRVRIYYSRRISKMKQ